MRIEADVREFAQQGFVAVQDCVPEAHLACEDIWKDLTARYDVGDDPSTWHGQYMSFPATALKGRDLLPSARMGQVLDDLLGEALWVSDHRSKSGGTIFASLPRTGEDVAWSLDGEWHWDQGENRHLPSFTGLQVCTLLTDADHQSGGTLFVSGSHHFVAAHFHRTRGLFSDNYSAARMQSFFSTERWFRNLNCGAVPKADRVATYMERTSTLDGIELRVHEMTGKAGDAYFLHPLLVHAAPRNGSDKPRIMHRSSVWHKTTTR